MTSGTARGVVINTGTRTLFGSIAERLAERREETSFDKGVRSFTWLMIRFMVVMVCAVYFIVGMTKGDWVVEALLFGLSIAVGLTPEMLPMIVTVNLAKGALTMARKKVVVKRLPSIQNFGAIDVLCTDKTGTLTQDRVRSWTACSMPCRKADSLNCPKITRNMPFSSWRTLLKRSLRSRPALTLSAWSWHGSMQPVRRSERDGPALMRGRPMTTIFYASLVGVRRASITALRTAFRCRSSPCISCPTTSGTITCREVSMLAKALKAYDGLDKLRSAKELNEIREHLLDMISATKETVGPDSRARMIQLKARPSVAAIAVPDWANLVV